MAVLAAAVVAVAGVLIWLFAFKCSSASESSPEEQIRALMRSADNYRNSADAAGLASLLCDAQRTHLAVTYTAGCGGTRDIIGDGHQCRRRPRHRQGERGLVKSAARRLGGTR